MGLLQAIVFVARLRILSPRRCLANRSVGGLAAHLSSDVRLSAKRERRLRIAVSMLPHARPNRLCSLQARRSVSTTVRWGVRHPAVGALRNTSLAPSLLASPPPMV